MTKSKKIILSEKEMPKQWYNIAADLPGTLNPPLGPDGKPIGPEALAPVFPMNLIEQEVSTERWIDIPEKVMESQCQNLGPIPQIDLPSKQLEKTEKMDLL